MNRLLVALVAIGSSTAMAGPEICGHGKPEMIDVGDAAADASATIFVGRVAAQHTSSDSSFEARTGTIEVDVQTVVQGVIRAARVVVPVWAAGCIPKAACLPSVFDIAKVGATVVAACVVPARGAPRIAVVAGDRPVPDDVRRCLAIDDTRAHGTDDVTQRRIAAIATAYVEGAELAKTCAAKIVCDDAQRAFAVRALVKTVLSPRFAADTALELAQGLTYPVSNVAALIGCPTTPKFFRPELGGSDATNALIARTMLDGMLAAHDVIHRQRWASLLWGMAIDWRDKPGEDANALHGLDKPFAKRASAMLRTLAHGSADQEHYEQLAKTIEAANP